MHDLPQAKSPHPAGSVKDDLTGWTIAFDLDGTLVETAPDLAGAMNTLLKEEGLPPQPYAELRVLIGRGGRWMIGQAFERAGVSLDEGQLDALLERWIAIYLGRIAHESVPFEGCLAALDDLAARGATLAVCTNKRTPLTLALLDALDMTGRFAAIIGADLAPTPKPDPSHLLLTVQQAGGDPARSILVGDTESDTRAARAANIPCIVVDFGYSQVPVEDLGGAAVISHFDGLAAAIAQLTPCPDQAGSL
jgi:phosphoglycolate phosphatase